MKRERALRSKLFVRVGIVVATFGLLAGVVRLSMGCGWDPAKPFERNAPEVEEALAALDAGQAGDAAALLEEYLGTGPCAEVGFGAPPKVNERPHAAFDLGLTLFSIGETFGHRFGDEDSPGDDPAAEDLSAKRSVQINCALLVTRAIANDPNVPIELRARAFYLAGNLEFLRSSYEDAVAFYDQSLALIPGVPEDAASDLIGRDAAWNRAIALRRIEEQKDAGNDAEPDADDASDDASQDAGDDGGNDGGDDGGQDAGQDAGNDGGGDDDAGNDGGGADGGDDGGADAGAEPPPSEPQPEEPEPPQEMMQDDRTLDRLEETPTYQEQEAKNQAGLRRGRTMEDK